MIKKDIQGRLPQERTRKLWTLKLVPVASELDVSKRHNYIMPQWFSIELSRI